MFVRSVDVEEGAGGGGGGGGGYEGEVYDEVESDWEGSML